MPNEVRFPTRKFMPMNKCPNLSAIDVLSSLFNERDLILFTILGRGIFLS